MVASLSAAPREDSRAELDSASRVAGGVSAEWDAMLVERVRAGEESAFEIVVRTYGPGLVGFAARIVGSPAAAEELVQDVFLRVWARRAELAVRDTLKTYLYRAVRNAALNRRREVQSAERGLEALRRQAAVEGERDAGGGSGVERTVQQAELVAAVRRAIAELPERCRLTFTLVRDRGLSYAEAAAVMGVSVKTVDAQLAKAIRALRESLRGVWP
jgi:RNA polymerase sigma-70 factor (ECF subfamily)